MSKVRNTLILVILMGGVAAASGFGPETAPEPLLLRDGFALTGVDGKLISSDSNDVWFFELSQDVNDYRAVAKAGTRLELLPSSMLEKMVADAKTRLMPTYRLWNAEVTKYKGRNFIFPRYFLPLREKEDEKPKTEDGKEDTEDEQSRVEGVPPSNRGQSLPRASRGDARDTSEVAVDEPNDILTVPSEIIERLKARRGRGTTTSLRQIIESSEVSAGESPPDTEQAKLSVAQLYLRGADSIFIDRTAFLVKQDEGGFVFVPDALGRNVQPLSLRLLPCEVLELTERKQSAQLEPLRFKIAGIMTRYNDRTYLLLQRATRTYSHGNFSR